MDPLVTYHRYDSTATITMDDGKVNALSFRMLTELNDAFDRAEADGAVVVLTGRAGVFSAGFDLSVLRNGGPDASDMVRAGFLLAARMLAYPTPVVVACSGHAIAMGAFLLLSGDYRLGVAGPYKITGNEVAIGITMPHAAVEICRQRLTPSHFNRAVTLAEVFAPADAVNAGFLDRLVEPGDLDDASTQMAAALAQLDLQAHAASKLRARGQALSAIRAAITTDDLALSPS